jgi:hypothetical protein
MNTLLNPVSDKPKPYTKSKDRIEIKVIFETPDKDFDQKYEKYNFNKLIEHFKPYPLLHDKIKKKHEEVKKLFDEGKPAHLIKKGRELQVSI